MLARHVTTVGDEEYENLIAQQLEGIVTTEMEKHNSELMEKDPSQHQFIYVKIVYELLRKLREDGFEVNDDKYLFLTSKVIQHHTQFQHHQDDHLRASNSELVQTVERQRQQIALLHEEVQALQQQVQAKRKRELSIVIEEREEGSMKRSSS